MRYSWADTVYKAFSKTFPNDYGDDALSFLSKCIKDEYRQARKDENSLEKLYACIGDFYKHFCWKINWKRDSLSSMKKSCIIILSYLIKTGIQLSKGKLSSKWINNILAAIKIFPGPLELICDAFILIPNVKKKCRSSFTAVLNHFLFTNKLKVSNAEDYFKVMLLFKTLKFLSKNKLERAMVVTHTLKITVPSDVKSWLLSHGIENLNNIRDKLLTRVLLNNKKLPPEFFIQLRNALKIEMQVEEDFYLSSNVTDPFVVDTEIKNRSEFTVENSAGASIIENVADMFFDSSCSGASLVKRKKEELHNLSTEDSIGPSASVDPSSLNISVVKRQKKKKSRLTNSCTGDSIDSTALVDPSSPARSFTNGNRDQITYSTSEDCTDSSALVNPSYSGEPVGKRKRKRNKLTNSCTEGATESNTLANPSSSIVSFVNRKTDKLKNCIIENDVDSTVVVNSSFSGESVVKRKRKKDKLANSCTEDTIDSNTLADPLSSIVSFENEKDKINSSSEDGDDSRALVDPSSPGISVVKRKKKDDILTSFSSENDVDSNQLSDPLSSGISVVNEKDKLLNSNITENRNIPAQKLEEEELLILPQLYSETKGTLNQGFFHLNSEAKEAMSNTFSEREVDSCSSNSVNNSFLNEAGFGNHHELLIDIAAEIALCEDDSKMSVNSSFDINTDINCIKREKMELTEPLDTEDNSKSNLILKHLPELDNEVEKIEHEKAMTQNLGAVSISKPLNSSMKDDDVKSNHLPLFTETKTKNQLIPGSNETCVHKGEVIHDKNEPINNKTVNFSTECSLISKADHFDEATKMYEINSLNNNSSINLEEKIKETEKVEYSTVYLRVSETCAEAFHVISPKKLTKNLVPETLAKEGSSQNFNVLISGDNVKSLQKPSVDLCLCANDEQSHNNEMCIKNKEASINKLGNYIEGVLYKLVDEVVSRINNEDDSYRETSKEKSSQSNLTPIDSSTDININESEFLSAVVNSCQTFSEISKLTAVDCKEGNSLSEAKSNLLDYRGNCSNLEVNQNNAMFLESDLGNEDTDKDVSDNESLSDSGELSFGEDSQLSDLEIENKNSCLNSVNDCVQSKCDSNLDSIEAASSVAELPCLSTEILKRCSYENAADANCSEKELTAEFAIRKLPLVSTESKDLSFSENSHEISLKDSNRLDFLKSKDGIVNCVCDTDKNELVLNESKEPLELEFYGTETPASGNSSYAGVFSKEVLQPVISIKNLESNCVTYSELKRIENKENLSCIESTVYRAQELGLEQSNPEIAGDEGPLLIHSQDSLNNTGKDSEVKEHPVREKDLSMPVGHLELPLTVSKSPLKQLRVLRQRKENPNTLSTPKRKKKLKIDHSDPVLTSNLSELTLNSPSITKPNISTEDSKLQSAKALRKAKVDLQISESQPESNKGYNLRSRKPLIRPSTLKF